MFLLHVIFMVSAYIQGSSGQACEAGVCSSILGTVYDPILNQCAWPDEVGCTLFDLGIQEDCNGYGAHALKPLTSRIPNLPPNRNEDQYFIVCVNALTSDDKLQDKPIATGPITARLLGCPDSKIFSPLDNICVN